MAKHLYGMHDWDERWGQLVRDQGVTAWAVPTFSVQEELSHDFTYMAQYGVTPLTRLNWGYGSTGTIPRPDQYDRFAQRCGEFVQGSRGCRHWIIGNEPNHPQEWPDNQPIPVLSYAQCYRLARAAIKAVQPDSVVVPAPVAPWTDQVGMGWVEYFERMLGLVEADALAIHTYTRGPDPRDITSEARIGAPYSRFRSGFRTYRDFLDVVPSQHQGLPVHITEFDENEPWADRNTGVVQAAYAEIDAWNRSEGTQKVRSLVLFRWPRFDERWHIEGKQGVIDDWRQAMQHRYEVPEVSSQPGGSSVYIPVVSVPGSGDQPTPLEWDPRLDQRGVKIESASVQSGQTYWRVIKGQWLDVEEARAVGPDHHILVNALDEKGQRVEGVSFVVKWPSGREQITTKRNDGYPWTADYGMSKSLNEFSIVAVNGLPSETVTGIGMGKDGNSGIHTSTLLTFQRTQKGATGTVAQPKAKVPPLVHPLAAEKTPVITQRFGDRPEYYRQFVVDGVPLRGHNGVDFGTPVGTRVVAVGDGRVVEVADEGTKGYGKYIKISHPWGESLYAHLDSQVVSVGHQVQAGQLLGRSGNTGNSSGPHLHFGLRVSPFDRRDGMGGFTDPSPFLKIPTAQQPPTQNPGQQVWPLVQKAATEFGVDQYLLASLAWAESSWRPTVTSPAGAMGLTQIMPATWAEWAPQVGATGPLSALDNLRVGAAYLAWLLKVTNNDVTQALYAYAWGVGNVLESYQPPADVVTYAAKIVHGRDLLRAVLGG